MDWREHVCSLQVVKESCTAALEIMSKLLKAVMPRPLVITSMVTISCSYYLMSSKYTSEYVLVVITKLDLYS